MNITSENGFFVRGGMVVFVRSIENEIFRSLSPLGLAPSLIDFLSEAQTLKTLTSLNKEVRPFFLGDNSIWRSASFSSLSDYSI